MKYLIIICLSCFVCTSSLFAYPSCSQDLGVTVNTLLGMPEARKILTLVEQEGPIKIQWGRFHHSGSYAMWKGDERTIVLNAAKDWTEGKKIRSILFELHNALANREFYQIDLQAAAGKLSKWEYVEKVERLEHKNVLKTVSIIQKGIKMQSFPQDTFWAVETNFGRHFKIQQETGHSQLIAQMYDLLRHDYFARKAA